MDVIANLKPADAPPAKDLGNLLNNVPDPDVKKVLSLLAAEAGPDAQKLKESIENWFNTSMDRVAGWYKRKTQVANVILAIIFTVGVNADGVLIARTLSSDRTLRAVLVAQAQATGNENPSPPQTGQHGTGPGPPAAELDQRIGR